MRLLITPPSRLLFVLTAILVVFSSAPAAQAQGGAGCGAAVTGRYGGETGGVALLNIATLIIGRGSALEIIDLSNTNAPARFNPPRVVGLPAPPKKIAVTLHNDRVFALLENGNVAIATVAYSPTVRFVGEVGVIYSGHAVDILADGDRVYIVRTDEHEFEDYISSTLDVYEVDVSGNASLRDWVRPFLDNYGFDRAVRIGNTLWLGMHEHDSSIFGIESYDISDPSNLTRISSSLNNAPLGTRTRVSAMAVSGNRLIMSYEYDTPTQSAEDWMRAVDVATPTSPVWHPAVDLNGFAGCMTVAGDHLRISILGSGVGTWNIANPASLTWLGAYFDAYPRVGQILIVGGNDHWAAGRGGLMTMNTANPAAVSVRSTLTNHPIGPSVVKQHGNTTVVLDYTLNTLRMFDYTLPEPQQLRSSIFLPLYAEMVEIGLLNGGATVLACVATKAPGSGDSITIYDITNPAAPVQRSQITGFEAHLMSVVNSRMYVMTTARELKIIELAQPLSPQVRSTTPFGGNWYDYTCLLGWEAGATKAVALGTNPFGLWIINVTDATAPLVSTVWTPASNYRVHAVAKGNNNFLYVSSRIEGTLPGSIAESRLETLNVSNLAGVTQRFVHRPGQGIGSPAVFDHLRFIAAPAGKFLVGTRGNGWEGSIDAIVQVFELPPGFLTGEGVPFLLSSHSLPHATGPAAANGNGSLFTLAGGPAGLYQMNTPVQWAPGYGLQSFDQTGCHAGSATFTAFPSANPTAVTLRWHRYGPSDPEAQSSPWVQTPLVSGPTGWGSTYSGVTETSLTISNIRGNDAKYYYYLAATNTCGTTNSRLAYLDFCPADFNCSGTVTVQDIFDFLSAYFALDTRADFNASGTITVQDIFDYLSAYFRPCF